MTHAYRFVALPDPNPTVILDVDNRQPFSVSKDSSVSPPTMRRTTAQGVRQDGDIELNSSFDSRQIKLALRVEQTAAEAQATSIQTLSQILQQREGAWLEWRDEAISKTLFFRTKRASYDVINDVLDANPKRALQVPLVADPFGYGLPEAGTADITNDPTSGSNKMLLTLPAIKGDVPAPLRLTFTTPDGVHKTMVTSYADYADGALAAPYAKALSGGTINSTPPTGWTVVDSSDATMVSGTRRVMTKTSGTALCRPTAAVMQQWAGLPPGNYRVMVRTDDATAGSEILFFNRPPSTGSELIYSEAAAKVAVSQTTTGKDWFDLGVVAMPGGAPLADVAFGRPGATGPALWNVAAYAAGAAMTVAFDEIVLVPAGRPGTLTKQGSVVFPATYTARTVTWDGLNGYRIANGISSFTAGVTSVQAPSEIPGGNPIVVPGATNFLHFFATTADPSSAARISDDKAMVTTVAWEYYPMYVNADRPTAT